ncbi:heme biosynthesis protein HemY [Tistrella bauzanensis]|uniref:Heme biosynthesis protein HemY n=1 Tax=Tistrella bauzanensis TaxID=657419 RepID=A0ABQ1I9W1_9PROT|nr:iron-sulfur cluster assembly accessory protein [Tistrella bauzanensis]GGB26927.1 heme biosynthesis protein HemY [Tistrella bauzanensis]
MAASDATDTLVSSSAPAGGLPPLTLSERAARHIRRISDKEGAPVRLRIAVSGGGCSGFQYEFSIDKGAVGADDVVIARDGAEALIDEASIPFVLGAELDFTEDLTGSRFAMTNPNATASCGCGTSFSVF